MSLNMTDILIAVNKAVKKANAYTDSKTQGVSGGINYCGAVAYYDNLPVNPEKGDAYTVKYAGSSGTTPDGTEYVWDFDTDLQAMAWIDWSKDCYTKAESTNMLAAAINSLTAAIETASSTYRGTYTTMETLNVAPGDKNDYAFYSHVDAAGNSVLDKYKFVPTEQVDLPEGYTQLEYIESSGTQYIDTGVPPTSKRRFYIKFNPLNYVYAVAFFGMTGFSNRGYSDPYYLGTDNGTGVFKIDGTSLPVLLDFPGVNEFEYNYPYITLNGESTSISDPGEWHYSTGPTIYLFALTDNGRVTRYSIMRLYGCKIYDTDGTTLIRDFVPCKNASNIAGLYDVINNVFYPNNGTGAFVAGPQANGYWEYEFTLSNLILTAIQLAALNSGINSTKVSQIDTNTIAITEDRAALVEVVDSGVKNVLAFNEIGTNNSHGTTFINNGVTWTLNEDGTVTATRTESSEADSSCNLRISTGSLYVDAYCTGGYILSGCPEGGGDNTYSLRALRDDAYRVTDTSDGILLPAKGESTNIYINMLVDMNFDGTVTFKPMICSKAVWDISKTYQPPRPLYIEGLITPTSNDYDFYVSGLESSVERYGNICVVNVQFYLGRNVSIPTGYQYLAIGAISGIPLPKARMFSAATVVEGVGNSGTTQASISLETNGQLQLFTSTQNAWTVGVQTGIFAHFVYTI